MIIISFAVHHGVPDSVKDGISVANTLTGGLELHLRQMPIMALGAWVFRLRPFDLDFQYTYASHDCKN